MNPAGDVQKRRQSPARLYHSQRAALFGYEQPTFGRELHGRRTRQVTDDLRSREVGRERRGTSAEFAENARSATAEANRPQSTIANISLPRIPFSERTVFELA